MTGAGVITTGIFVLPGIRQRLFKSKTWKVETHTSLVDNAIIDYLPETIPYLIIGGGAASFAAVRSIRSNDPKAKVVVITDEPYTPYMKPPLTKEIWFTPPEIASTLNFRQYDGRDRPLSFEKDEFYFPLNKLMSRETGGVTVLSRQKVYKIDPRKQVVFLENGQSVGYEKCLLATGGQPKTHPVIDAAPQAVKDHVTMYRKASDFLKLLQVVEAASAANDKRTIAIIGGGFLGSELACSLGRRSKGTGLKVVQVLPEHGNLHSVLPEYLSRWVTDKIREESVTVIPETDIIGAKKLSNGRLALTLSSGETLEADHAVVAVGLSPQVDIAQTSGLETHPDLGGFVVNGEMEARSNLWVAGDASCFFDSQLGRRRRVEHHDHAIVTGRLSGENMTGAKKEFQHQSMFWSDLGPEIGFEAVGHIDSSLETVGVFQQKDDSKPDYSRGLVFYLDPKSKRIQGILLWNVFNRIRLARRVIRDLKQHDDLSEVAKLFAIYSSDE